MHYLAALLLFGTASVSLPGAVVSEKTEANGRGNTEYQPFSRTKCCFIATNRGFYIVTQKYKHFTLRARKKLPVNFGSARAVQATSFSFFKKKK